MRDQAPTIDVHTHVVPAGLPFGFDERFPSLAISGAEGTVLVGGVHFRTVTRAAWDVEARLEDMAGHGVTMQAISPMPELCCYWAEAAEGAAFCLALNTEIAAMVAAAPEAFVGLGSVPLQDLVRAIEALDTVQALGLVGVQVGSNVNGTSVGHERFVPFFQAAAAANLAVFVHAFHPPHWGCVADPPMAAAVTFPSEIGTCAAALVANGIVERSPGLRLGISHGGGTLALHLPRMAHFWTADEARAARASGPLSAARSMWFDCLTYDPSVLSSLLGTVGAERVMVGSDYPFFAPAPGYLLDLVDGIDDTVLRTVRVASARSFLALPPGGPDDLR